MQKIDVLIIAVVCVIVEVLKLCVFKSAQWFKNLCPYVTALLAMSLSMWCHLSMSKPMYEAVLKGLLNTGLSVFGYDAVISKLKETDVGQKIKEYLENVLD